MTTPAVNAENLPAPALLALLVCPVTRLPLEYDAARGVLISKLAKLAYPVKDGVPILLPDVATALDSD